MAFVLHTSERELFICSPGSALISLKTLINDDGIKRFCVEIAQNVIDQVSNSKMKFVLLSQCGRKKSPSKKLVKSNKSKKNFFFVKLHFWLF